MPKSNNGSPTDGVVLTPAGPRSKSKVKQVEAGQAVRVRGDEPEIVSTRGLRANVPETAAAAAIPVRYTLRRKPTDPDYVVTPAGLLHKSNVHVITPGNTLDLNDQHMRELDRSRRVVQDHGPLAPLRRSALLEGVEDQILPALGSGWIVYTGWTNNTGTPIDYFATTWTVPSPPLTRSDQLIYIFNGLQDASGGNFIFQPVLQWGNNGTDGGDFWQVATWFVTTTKGVHSPFVRVNPGDVLKGVMTLTGRTRPPAPVTTFSYYGEFEGIRGTGFTVTTLLELKWAAETLEAYNVDEASDYATRRINMRAIDLRTGGAAPTPALAWNISNSITDVGQDTVVVADGTPNGEVNLYSYDLAQIAVGNNADGRLELFYTNRGNGLYHRWQTAPSNGWADDWPLGTGNFAKQLHCAQNADGRLEVFYVGTNDRIYHNWQTAPNNGWSGESALGGWAKQIAVERNADGRLEIFYVGTNDRLYHNWQEAPNSDWNGEDDLGGSAKQLCVGRNQDGRLEVFYVGTDDRIYHTWQTAPNNGWSGEAAMGGWGKQVAVASNADGRLEIFYIGTNDRIYHSWQTAPNSGWSGEAELGGLAKQLVVGRNADGRLEVLYIGMDDGIYHRRQTAPNNGWGAEQWMGSFARQLTVGRNADGRLELFYVGTNGALLQRWQVAPNAGWSGEARV
jgi:hypothetical protein